MTIELLKKKLEPIVLDGLVHLLNTHFAHIKVAYVKLYYRSHQWYIPLVTIITDEKLVEFCKSNGYDPLLAFNPVCWSKDGPTFEIGYSPDSDDHLRFVDLLNQEEKWEEGTQMLRSVCKTITNQYKSTGCDDFICFVMDDEFEYSELEVIMKDCGASPTQLRKWKEKNWLD
jgi:hypothetical protein